MLQETLLRIWQRTVAYWSMLITIFCSYWPLLCWWARCALFALTGQLRPTEPGKPVEEGWTGIQADRTGQWQWCGLALGRCQFNGSGILYFQMLFLGLIPHHKSMRICSSDLTYTTALEVHSEETSGTCPSPIGCSESLFYYDGISGSGSQDWSVKKVFGTYLSIEYVAGKQ